jgi:Ca2+/H+ antiporter, TMEM165/GDT1 family
MDSLLITFLSVLLAECGNRPQLLAARLASRFQGSRIIWLAAFLALSANALIAAYAGSFVAEMISEDPVQLFIAIAYLFAAISMVWRPRSINLLENWKVGPFWTSSLGVFIVQFGDRAQFLTLAQAAKTPAWGFTALGGFLGSAIIFFAAMLFKDKFVEIVPVEKIRKIAAVLFLSYGLYLAMGAWRLL